MESSPFSGRWERNIPFRAPNVEIFPTISRATLRRVAELFALTLDRFPSSASKEKVLVMMKLGSTFWIAYLLL